MIYKKMRVRMLIKKDKTRRRLAGRTEEKAGKIRGIAWAVVHKYAKRVYSLDFGVADDEYSG